MYFESIIYVLLYLANLSYSKARFCMLQEDSSLTIDKVKSQRGQFSRYLVMPCLLLTCIFGIIVPQSISKPFR